MDEQLPIGIVSKLTGVTVRALHHYDPTPIGSNTCAGNKAWSTSGSLGCGRSRQQ
jgi:hypothetical protein